MSNNQIQEVCAFMPQRIESLVKKLLSEDKRITEIRLRRNLPLVMCLGNCTCFVSSDGTLSSIPNKAISISEKEIRESFLKLCHYSVYSYDESLNACYITTAGGNRVGIAGCAVMKSGGVHALKDISSLNFRLAKQVKGCEQEVLRYFERQTPDTTLIVGAPGSGKTTLLREMCRAFSSGFEGKYRKCCIIDERGEIAAFAKNTATFDVGLNTDVLSSFPKATGIMCALRTLSPEWMIVDEIGSTEEVKRVLEGLNSGVKFLLSMHAASFEEALAKPQYCLLKENEALRYVVVLCADKSPGKIERILKL